METIAPNAASAACPTARPALWVADRMDARRIHRTGTAGDAAGADCGITRGARGIELIASPVLPQAQVRFPSTQ